MKIEKCDSLFGHKFQARYDKSPANIDRFMELPRKCEGMLDRLRKETYVFDICVRCGIKINRHDV